MRILDEQYYDSAYWSWLLKTGQISQPAVIHNKPEDYGLTFADSVKIRIKCLHQQVKDLEDEYSAIKREYMQGQRPYGFIGMNSLQDQISKLSKSIYFNRQRLKPNSNYETFDIEKIKQIPIPQITRVNANGFFQTNPFRTEKEPSNSLYWYKNTNRFCDFATNKTGDVVDVYMAVQNVDLKTALKELSSL